MEFANNLKLENCIYHKDVIDAMFRETKSDDTKPFASNVVGKSIMAADYDMGRNRYAYMDKDTGNYWVSGQEGAGNHGYTYRNDGVDVYENNGAYYVDKIETGEWLKYTVNSSKAGKFNLTLNVASDKPCQVTFNGNIAVIPDTKGQWQQIPAGKLSLKKGKNVITIAAVEGGFKFQSFDLK